MEEVSTLNLPVIICKFVIPPIRTLGTPKLIGWFPMNLKLRLVRLVNKY